MTVTRIVNRRTKKTMMTYGLWLICELEPGFLMLQDSGRDLCTDNCRHE